jgi:predicted  nucleic acid-binding Zn-ribbon protein
MAVSTGTGFLALNAAASHADIQAEVQHLQSSLSDLQEHSSFSSVISDLTNTDTALQRASELLESARDKGYVYQSELETLLYDSIAQWETVRAQVSQIVEHQSHALQGQLAALNPMIQSLNRVIAVPTSASNQLRTTQNYVNNLLTNVTRMESDLQGRYGPIQSNAQTINARLKDVHWALDQLSQAKFQVESGEDLIMAVPARWDKEGKDDPEGVLYLSNRRFVFERKEKVATKKVLFITTASELVQEIIIDQPLSKLSDVQAENKGLFGHQDFLRITFSDTQIGTLSIHINGQDSKDWAGLLVRAKSGQIEAERAGAGAGLSIEELTRPLTPADLVTLQSEVNALQDEVMLKEAREELVKLENDVRLLERKLAEVRARGYVIEKDLEADVAILSAQWDRVKRNSESTLEYQSKVLGEQMQAIQKDLAQVMGMSTNLVVARPQYMQVRSALASLQAQADAAEVTVLTQYDEYADEIEGLHAHLEWVNWMLEALSTASFRLLATESGVAATEAVLLHPDWQPENGVLYLTDQRLLWEDRVGTFELRLEVPISEVIDARGETSGESGANIFKVGLGANAPLPEARFQFSQPLLDDWTRMVGRARSGGYAQDRAISVSPDELERIRNAPQACPQCGAALTAPILRGQAEITCEYCSHVTRI